jgi:hypothetical protein
MRAFLLLCCLLAPVSLSAQDRDGNDRPSDWVVDHYKPFGLWDSACDHRDTDGVREERCYLRYVEVFSPRPKFAAQFIFVTPGPTLEIGLERGTLFPKDGIRIEDMTGVLWRTDRILCRTGLSCTFDGDDAQILLNAMVDGSVFAFDFTDRHGAPRELRWDLNAFGGALADFTAESKARGLN